MNREQMIHFVIKMLKCSEDARACGGLRADAEEFVDRWLSQEAA